MICKLIGNVKLRDYKETRNKDYANYYIESNMTKTVSPYTLISKL